MRDLKMGIAVIFFAVIVVFALYGAYWLIKTVSYALFYEDMVQQTVRDMVKPETLK